MHNRIVKRKPATLIHMMLGAVAAAVTILPAHAQYTGMSPTQTFSSMQPAVFASSGVLMRQSLNSTISRSSNNAFSNPAPSVGFFEQFGTSHQAGENSLSGTTLNYAPSPAVSASVRDKFIEASAGSNSTARSQLERAFANDAVMKAFSQLLSKYGYSPTNLADVMTAYYVVCWEVVTGSDAAGNSGAIRAVNTQLRNALSNNPGIQQLSDSDKQQTAEVMAYQTVIAGSAKNELIKRGDQAGLQQLRQSVRQGVLQMGVDLSRLKLTSQGFVPAS